ncbi:MAG: phenylacetate-CoA oxygenase subunit PaaJ [Ignavibacteria bacterium]|nr:phenylacetate-CoA oxygenase subunit PaaJ [Ignavibacteria bacterium]
MTAVLKEDIYSALESVMDPEIPVLSVLDLGMITDVIINDDKVTVMMLPTFTACPAIKYIQHNISSQLNAIGYKNVEVILDTENKWTSDRMREGAKEKLEKFGLGTPPVHHGAITNEMIEQSKCPYCGSTNTTLNSLFGSTLCRSMHLCFDCKMKFERFKPIG